MGKLLCIIMYWETVFWLVTFPITDFGFAGYVVRRTFSNLSSTSSPFSSCSLSLCVSYCLTFKFRKPIHAYPSLLCFLPLNFRSKDLLSLFVPEATIFTVVFSLEIIRIVLSFYIAAANSTRFLAFLTQGFASLFDTFLKSKEHFLKWAWFWTKPPFQNVSLITKAAFGPFLKNARIEPTMSKVIVPFPWKFKKAKGARK